MGKIPFQRTKAQQKHTKKVKNFKFSRTDKGIADYDAVIKFSRRHKKI